MSLGSQTVRVLRRTKDAYGDFRMVEDGTPVLEHPGCSLQPAGPLPSGEVQAGRWELWAPGELKAGRYDLLEVDGVAYDGAGSLQVWTDTDGTPDHTWGHLNRWGG